MQGSILLFNVGCSSILLMDSFEVDILITYASYVAFNFLALVYGITIPIIVHVVLPEWQKESRRLVSRHLIFRKKNNAPFHYIFRFTPVSVDRKMRFNKLQNQHLENEWYTKIMLKKLIFILINLIKLLIDQLFLIQTFRKYWLKFEKRNKRLIVSIDLFFIGLYDSE